MVTKGFSTVQGIQRIAAQVDPATVIHVAPIIGPNAMNTYAQPLVMIHANARQGAIRHVKYGLAQSHVLINKRFIIRFPVLQVLLECLQSSLRLYQPVLLYHGSMT